MWKFLRDYAISQLSAKVLLTKDSDSIYFSRIYLKKINENIFDDNTSS